jgi:hypothetical protein
MGNDRATTKSPVPEARQKLAGGATTGQRPRNMSRALKGREKGTRGLAGNIAEGMRTLLAPLPGRWPSGAVRFRWFHHRLTSFEPPARAKEIHALSGFEEPVRQSLLVFFEVIAWASDLQFINQFYAGRSRLL